MFKYYFFAKFSLLALMLAPAQIGRHFADANDPPACQPKTGYASIAREQLRRMAAQQSRREAIAVAETLRADRDALRASVVELKDRLALLQGQANTAIDSKDASEAELFQLRRKLDNVRAEASASYQAELKQLREETAQFVARSDVNLELLARGRENLQEQLLATHHKLRLVIARSIAKRQKFQRSLLTIASLRRQLAQAAETARQAAETVQQSKNEPTSAVEAIGADIPAAASDVPAAEARPVAKSSLSSATPAVAKTLRKRRAARRPTATEFDYFVFP